MSRQDYSQLWTRLRLALIANEEEVVLPTKGIEVVANAITSLRQRAKKAGYTLEAKRDGDTLVVKGTLIPRAPIDPEVEEAKAGAKRPRPITLVDSFFTARDRFVTLLGELSSDLDRRTALQRMGQISTKAAVLNRALDRLTQDRHSSPRMSAVSHRR